VKWEEFANDKIFWLTWQCQTSFWHSWGISMKLKAIVNHLEVWIFHFNSGCKQTLKYLNYPWDENWFRPALFCNQFRHWMGCSDSHNFPRYVRYFCSLTYILGMVKWMNFSNLILTCNDLNTGAFCFLSPV